ncbi:MAG TPA: glycosyltransferase [Gaiellaceae bacterium]|nr:glycosyltransferase [Gaiellaceae bacterium]
MRIAYALFWNVFREDGVTKKIEGQVGAWRRAGHDVRIFCLAAAPPDADAQPVLDVELHLFGSLRDRLTRSGAAWARALLAWEPDVVYARHDTMPPAFERVLVRRPSVLEVNTVGSEARLYSLQSHLYHVAVGSRFLRRARGLVYISRATAAERARRDGGKHVAVIANGGDPDRFPLLPAPANDRPHLVFLGTPDQRWQGVDKVLALARANPDFHFDLVGPAPGDLPDRPENVLAHGYLAAATYRPLLERADAALGTLALHRKSRDDASPLKVREYLLHGIPTVIGYDDTDFGGGDHWYLLRLPNTEDNVSNGRDAIRAFVERVRGGRAPRDEVVARIGVTAKEEQRLRLLKEVAGA